MSKIGRKSIDVSGVSVEVKGQDVHYKGAKASGVYVLPEVLEVQIADDKLMMVPNKAIAQASKVRDVNPLIYPTNLPSLLQVRRLSMRSS